MATKTLNDFTLARTAASDDFVVGFDTAVANGERKWTVSTIAKAVSGLIKDEMANFMNTTLTLGNYPYLEYAWVTTPATIGQLVAADTAGSLPVAVTVTTKTWDTHNIVSQAVAANRFRVPAGTYHWKIQTMFGGSSTFCGDTMLYLYDVTNSVYIAKRKVGETIDGVTEISGTFKITTDCNFEARVMAAQNGYIGYLSYSQNAMQSTMTDGDQRFTIQLWKVA